MAKLNPKDIPAQIVAELTPLIASVDSTLAAHEKAEAEKSAMLDKGNIIVTGGSPISNNADFNALVKTIGELQAAHEAAISKLTGAVTRHQDFVLDLFEPILEENRAAAYQTALRYELGNLTPAHGRINQFASVWPLQSLIAAVAQNGSNRAYAARLIVLHLGEYVAGIATGSPVAAETAKA